MTVVIVQSLVSYLQVRLMHERGYHLGNVDITIIAQQPKLSPHKENMRDQLCQLLGSHPSTVNIKVSTELGNLQLLATVCCIVVPSMDRVRFLPGVRGDAAECCSRVCFASHSLQWCSALVQLCFAQ